MDTQQLKLLAGQVRGLLQQSNNAIGHSQSLDVIAALPGLRNWPEVQAFPNRVAACELDLASTSRLSFRLKRKFEVDLPANELLTALAPSHQKIAHAPQVWPAGPQPGVYLTTSGDAIDALLELYEDATDGALVYAERAGSHWAGSIDLGENGLWSAGLDRVPSGTLLVVGPILLDQQSWEESCKHLEMACNHADLSGHRVAVLLDTPCPDDVFEDVALMVRSLSGREEVDPALIGYVTEAGALEQRIPFARPRAKPKHSTRIATTQAIPPIALDLLRTAINDQTHGILLFGRDVLDEHRAIELVTASLALTEEVGPAARIMPRHRSTPAKDWNVPEAIGCLPYLPSIESAYEQGYRRMIIASGYTEGEPLLTYGNEVLFMAGSYGSDVSDVFLGALRLSRGDHEEELLRMLIAILGVTPLPTKQGTVDACDLYVRPNGLADNVKGLAEIDQFIRDNRVLRWEEQVTDLLNRGQVSARSLKKGLPRNRRVSAFLDEFGRSKKAN